MDPILQWLPVASAIAIYLARILELRTRRNTVAGPVRETLTLRLFMLAGTHMLLGGIAEYFWRDQSLNWITFILGWACAAASFSIRRSAIAALGQFWSLHVEIRQNHEFVNTGPFRWMRHPTYFSMILELLSLGLILNALFTLPVVAVIFLPTLLLRLRLEETALVEKFGNEYREYQRKTPMLFPFRIPRNP
jgi:protein-S-isoprenylcysteine O-methyltransferase Ste14